MLVQEALQQALLSQFTQLKAKNSAYSLRAFAQRLGVNSGALSSILNGRRRVSVKYAMKLTQKMTLPPKEIARLESLLALEMKTRKRRTSADAEENKALELRSDQFHVIADGIHFSILCLMETVDFRSDVDWIALRLNESAPRVRQAFERLSRIGLVEQKREVWKLTTGKLKTSDGIADRAIRRFHEERLDEAKTKLELVPVEDRDFFASTMAIQRSQIPAARELIRAFKKNMETLLECEPRDEVYRLCIQLFPVTDLKSKESK
jgi:uncharacterized protein (TIGR02147 family)